MPKIIKNGINYIPGSPTAGTAISIDSNSINVRIDNDKVILDSEGRLSTPEPPEFTQVNADWLSSEGPSEILNKPNIRSGSDANFTGVIISGSIDELETNVASGEYSTSVGYATSASGANSYAEGYLSKATKNESHAEGRNTLASGNQSHAEGNSTKAQAPYSHAEGNNNTISSGANAAHIEGQDNNATGRFSHAEGYQTKSRAQAAHAEGISTDVTGLGGHAEGSSTLAEGEASHAEGYSTSASGNYAHAEGQHTVASTESTHAEGIGTIASGMPGQHVQGTYNVEDTVGRYIDIVGGGSSDANRKNLSALTSTGNLILSGNITLNANNDSTGGYVIPAPVGLDTTKRYMLSFENGRAVWSEVVGASDLADETTIITNTAGKLEVARSIYDGTSVPQDALGKPGDIYFLHS